MTSYKDLRVWAKAHELTLIIYAATKKFPREELFELTNQLRRAASSIPTNLAEGHGRHSKPELHRFTQIARGSATEVEYQLLLARDLGYLQDTEYRRLDGHVQELQRMLTAFALAIAPKKRKSGANAKVPLPTPVGSSN